MAVDGLFKLLGNGETSFALIFLVIIILLMVYAVAGTLFESKHIHIIHETGLGIIIGCIVGGFMYLLDPDNLGSYNFGEKIFFYGLLPPMIFEAGYNVKKSKLFQNFNYIALYGIVGTLVSFFVTTGLTIAINELGWIREFKDFNNIVKLTTPTILLYSATICATDSVAALTMIKSTQYPKLFSILFGEGMVNDAVAIILFKSVYQMFYEEESHDANIDTIAIFNIIKNFLINLVCSLLIGILCSILCTLTFKNLRFLANSVTMQVVLSFLFGILSYALSEIFEFSGVISVLVCGITMAHFNFYNLTKNGQLATGTTFKCISFAAESFLFVYLGISSWNYVGSAKTNYEWSLTFVFLQILVCAFSRFCSTLLLSAVVYPCMRKKWSVNIYELGIVWFSGVIRGSVAFALILTVPADPHDPHSIQETQIIKSSVLIIVILTTVILGALMPGFVKRSLEKADEAEKKKRELLGEKAPAQETQKTPLIEGDKQKAEKKGAFKKFFNQIDEKYFKRWLIYDYQVRKEDIRKQKKWNKLNSAQFKGVQEVGEKRQSLLGSDMEENHSAALQE